MYENLPFPANDDGKMMTFTQEQLFEIIREKQDIISQDISNQLKCQISNIESKRNDWQKSAEVLHQSLCVLKSELKSKEKIISTLCSKCEKIDEGKVIDKNVGTYRLSHPSAVCQAENPLSSSNVQVLEGPRIIDLTDEEEGLCHPAPPPSAPEAQWAPPDAKEIPPRPTLKCTLTDNGISLNWTASVTNIHEAIKHFQLYSYQQTTLPPSTSLWKKIGNVKALPLPMACTLSQFQAGNKYYFAVRAMDVHQRVSEFSEPSSVQPSKQ